MNNNISPLKKSHLFLSPDSSRGIKRASASKKIYMSSIASLSQSQIKSNFHRNSLKIRREEKDNKNLFFKANNNNGLFLLKSDLRMRLRERKNKINLYSINNEYFYKIRKKINQYFKNKYKGPYMEHLIKKGYYKKRKKEDYPIYDNYYQICHLMNKKSIQLSLKYDEFKLFSDNQEYLLKFLDINEQYIIMNYLLYYIYNFDKCSIVENSKKMATNKQIRTMFFQLLKNNYKFDGTLEILDNIGVYFRMVFSNTGKNVIFLEKLKPVLKPEIKYLYIKDVPKYLIPNCLPNLFPVINKKIKYLLIYLKSIKYNRIVDLEFFEEKKFSKELDLSKKYFSKKFKPNNLTRNKKERSFTKKSSSEASKYNENQNILDNNLSSSTDKEENSPNTVNMEQIKNTVNINKKLNPNNNELLELEEFLEKFEQPVVRKPKKKPTIREKKSFIFKQEIKKKKSLSQIDEINTLIDKINDDNDNDNDFLLFENKRDIIKNNKRLSQKFSQREIFQTSLRGPSAIIKKHLNNKFKTNLSQINENEYIESNELSKRNKLNVKDKIKNSNSSFLSSFRNKKEKKYIKYFLRKTHNDMSSNLVNFSKLNTKDITNSFKSQLNIKQKNELNSSNLDYKTKSYNSKSINNIGNSKNFPDFLYKNLDKIIKKDEKDENGIYKRNYKNFRIKKFPSLKEFEYIYGQIKEMGLLPKNKMIFHGNKFRAFSDFSGIKIIDNKEFNEWAEEKEEESIIKSKYSLANMKRKINQENKRNKNINRNLCTLKQIIKSSNIYY